MLHYGETSTCTGRWCLPWILGSDHPVCFRARYWVKPRLKKTKWRRGIRLGDELFRRVMVKFGTRARYTRRKTGNGWWVMEDRKKIEESQDSAFCAGVDAATRTKIETKDMMIMVMMMMMMIVWPVFGRYPCFANLDIPHQFIPPNSMRYAQFISPVL